MSIIGIGVDIESIDRFELVGLDRLIKRVFTPAETKYCLAQARPARHFAARFAAKEAVVKALATVCPKLLITQVEIYKEEGCPVPLIRLLNGVALPANISLSVSLSHADPNAIAFVVAEQI
jgi:holo-[acyl-carrier protein] synthase